MCWFARAPARCGIAGSQSCAERCPPSQPLRHLPLHIADGRLLGGLDLNATLLAGRPVAERGLLRIAKNFKVMSMEFVIRDNKDQAVIWRGPMKHRMIHEFLSEVDWGDLDFRPRRRAPRHG